MHMVGPHVALQNLDVLTATERADQIPHPPPDLPRQHRLAGLRYFVVKTNLLPSTTRSAGSSLQWQSAGQGRRAALPSLGGHLVSMPRVDARCNRDQFSQTLTVFASGQRVTSLRNWPGVRPSASRKSRSNCDGYS